MVSTSSPASRSSPPTLKSVAQLAGVSYATVSRVVNAAGDVAPETARRVQAIVDELGYRPNGHALTLHGRTPPLVGLVFSGRMPRGLIDSTRRGLAAAGVPLVLCPVDGVLGESAYLELLRDGRFGALVVDGAQAVEPAVIRVARTGRVVIAIDPTQDPPACIIRANRAMALRLGLSLRFAWLRLGIDGPCRAPLHCMALRALAKSPAYIWTR